MGVDLNLGWRAAALGLGLGPVDLIWLSADTYGRNTGTNIAAFRGAIAEKGRGHRNHGGEHDPYTQLASAIYTLLLDNMKEAVSHTHRTKMADDRITPFPNEGGPITV